MLLDSGLLFYVLGNDNILKLAISWISIKLILISGPVIKKFSEVVGDIPSLGLPSFFIFYYLLPLSIVFLLHM